MELVRTLVRVALQLEVLVELETRPPKPDTEAFSRTVAAATEKLSAAINHANKVLAAGVDAGEKLRKHGVSAPVGAVQLTLSATGGVSMTQITGATLLALYDDRNEALRECMTLPTVEDGDPSVPPFRPAQEVQAEQQAAQEDAVGAPLIAELMAQAGLGRRGVVLDFPVKELPDHADAIDRDNDGADDTEEGPDAA